MPRARVRAIPPHSTRYLVPPRGRVLGRARSDADRADGVGQRWSMGSCRHGRSTHEVSASAVPCTAAGISRSSDKRPWGHGSANEGGTSLLAQCGDEQHLTLAGEIVGFGCGTWGAGEGYASTSESYAKWSSAEGGAPHSDWARAFGEHQRRAG